MLLLVRLVRKVPEGQTAQQARRVLMEHRVRKGRKAQPVWLVPLERQVRRVLLERLVRKVCQVFKDLPARRAG